MAMEKGRNLRMRIVRWRYQLEAGTAGSAIVGILVSALLWLSPLTASANDEQQTRAPAKILRRLSSSGGCGRFAV